MESNKSVFIHSLTMLTVKQYYDIFLVTNLIPYSIVTSSDTVLILISFQFDTPMRTRMLLQHLYLLNDSVIDSVR